MEQTELQFPDTDAHYTVTVTCDGVVVDLPEGAPDSFSTHADAQDYLTKVKDLLEDSAFGIRIDLQQSGWTGMQKQNGMSVLWRAKVHAHNAPAPKLPIL